MQHPSCPPVRPGGTPCRRRYAVSELAPREVLVLHSMVRLLDGQTRDHWVASDPSETDLLVCRDAAAAGQGVAHLQLGGCGEHALSMPLRADELRAGLDRVSESLQLRARPPRPRPAAVEEFRRLHLLQWPEAMLLRHEPHYVQLTTVLGAGPCSVDELSARTGVPLASCHAFAAKLHASGAAEWLIDPPPGGSAGLLSRLRALAQQRRA